MNIATAQLTIPRTIAEIDRRAAGALHALPRRPARWSPTRLLAAWRAGERDTTDRDHAAIATTLVATDALTRTAAAGPTPRND